MNYDTVNHPLWPHERETLDYYVCDSCGEKLSRGEAEDPIIYKGRIFCDFCASDMMAFRTKPFSSCAEKVRKL